MSEIGHLAFALCMGMLLGLLFFGGLWWTTRRVSAFRHPGSSILLSLLLRMGSTMFGFYLVGGIAWQRWLACLAGFLLARALITWRIRRVLDRGWCPSPEPGRAP